jgi:hypothetical protein
MEHFWNGFEKKSSEKDKVSGDDWKKLLAKSFGAVSRTALFGTTGWQAGKALVRGAGGDPKKAFFTPLATALTGISLDNAINRANEDRK